MLFVGELNKTFNLSGDDWLEEDNNYVPSSEPLSGYTRHPEICKAISEGRQGIVFSAEHRENLSKAHANRKRQPHSEQTKERISAANKGKQRSVEQKKTISEATREAMRIRNEKTYLFTSPEGEEIIETTTIAEFARKHDLNKGSLLNVLAGRRKTARGWKVRLVE